MNIRTPAKQAPFLTHKNSSQWAVMISRAQNKFAFVKCFLLLLFTFCVTASFSQPVALSVKAGTSPFASFSEEWNTPTYALCNTAANANYMSKKEKEVIYILNLVRANPALFARTVVAQYPTYSQRPALANDKYYFKSLLIELSNLGSLSLLTPNERCFYSAQCHAYSAGEKGYTGHKRLNSECKGLQYFFGECCDYGNSAPLDIVVSLLIDQNVSSLGHRKILLRNYTSIGVSIQPHSTYGENTVLDLSF